MAEPNLVIAALTRLRTVLVREYHERCLRWAQDVGATLRPRALLEQHELAPLEVLPRLGEDRQDLEGKEHLSVEVSVERVPVARAIAQDEWGRANLAGGPATGQQLVVVERERVRVAAEARRPLIRDRRQMR
jgi:hypothetical protein